MRSAMDIELSHYQLTKESANPSADCNVMPLTPTRKREQDLKDKLAESLFEGRLNSTKILSFSEKAPEPITQQSSHKVLYSTASVKPLSTGR
jgi:hypothetical protein